MANMSPQRKRMIDTDVNMFQTPVRSNSIKKRPQTAVKGRLSSLSPAKDKKQTKKEKEIAAMGLSSLVKKKDRLKAQQVLDYLTMLVTTADRLKDPLDDIQEIFKKIEAWKDSYGNLDQQEKMIARVFSNKDSQIQIHNVKTLHDKINEFAEEAKLTVDDINIILFTSIDHDYLTNLLVLQGQFNMWFNLNFEGESQEEIDFRVNKCELWNATVFQAKSILKAAEEIKSRNESLEQITSKKWWEHMRFLDFGEALKAGLQN